MKKQKREKLKNIWNKIKKPLMIFSIIGNILFLMVIVIGCTNTKRKVVSQVSAVETYERHNLNGVTDLNGLTLYMPDVPFPYGKMADYYQWTTAISTGLKFHIGNSEVNYIEISTGGQSAVGNYYTECYNMVYWKGTNHNIESDKLRVYGSTLAHNDNNANPLGWLNDDVKVLTFFTSTNSTNSSTIDYLDLMGMTLTDPNAPVEPDNPIEENEIVKSIYLSDSFIPSAYVTQNGDYMFNGFAGKNSNAETHIVHLKGLTFLSNGETFNTISLFYAPLNAVSSRVTQDGQTLVDTTSYGDYICCIAIKYQYVLNDVANSSVTVCSPRRSLIVENGENFNVYDVRPPFNVWVNENYRKIDVLDDDKSIQNDSLLTITNKSTLELLQVTTNVSQDVMGFANVFTLMSSAFAGLASILGISILPGITIGLLLFIPLIVVIIISVIKIIKK